MQARDTRRRIVRKLARSGGIHLGYFDIHSPRPVKLPQRYFSEAPASGKSRISLVTPVLNKARFLAQTIESVLAQEYSALEYILKDGGSTDGTLEIAESYKGRISFLLSGRDRGQADAINIGFEHATGDILGYLNADDLLMPGALNYVARYFESNPTVDVVYGHRIVIDADGRETGRWVLPRHDDRILSWVDFVPQETLFWRRRIWEQIGGAMDTSFQFALDWDLLIRMRECGARVVRLPRFLGAFRVYADHKTSAVFETIGAKEISRIRQRCLGRSPSWWQVALATSPYLLKHAFLNQTYRLLGWY
jgi:glycosyltransferase involved in cell wall biosynthesis